MSLLIRPVIKANLKTAIISMLLITYQLLMFVLFIVTYQLLMFVLFIVTKMLNHCFRKEEEEEVTTCVQNTDQNSRKVKIQRFLFKRRPALIFGHVYLSHIATEDRETTANDHGKTNVVVFFFFFLLFFLVLFLFAYQ